MVTDSGLWPTIKSCSTSKKIKSQKTFSGFIPGLVSYEKYVTLHPLFVVNSEQTFFWPH